MKGDLIGRLHHLRHLHRREHVDGQQDPQPEASVTLKFEPSAFNFILAHDGRTKPEGNPQDVDSVKLTNAAADQPTAIPETTLSPQQFLDVSQWTYHHSHKPPFGFLNDEHGQPIYEFDRGAGFYGAALHDTKTGQVIVAFEGTDLFGDLKNDPVFVGAQIATDAQLYFGLIPEAFQLALDFTNNVIAEAAAQNISKDHVVVTGHSLGAAEAEYVASQLGLGGATFGGPGIASTAVQSNRGDPVLVNYLERGDPVGHYSSDAGNKLSNLLFSPDIEHYGEVHEVGSFLGTALLGAANSKFAPGSTAADKLEGLGLLIGAVHYHLPDTYRPDLPSHLSTAPQDLASIVKTDTINPFALYDLVA